MPSPPENPMYQYPRYLTGPDALIGFLKATRNTPTVGQNVFEFTVRARTKGEAERFVHSIRGALSKQRAKFKKLNNRAPQRFTLKTISIHLDKPTGLALIALGRTQRGSTSGNTLGIEMMQLLSKDYTSTNDRWGHMMERLRTEPKIHIDASDWDGVALAVILVYQQNAVYNYYDAENNTHVISRV